MRTPALLLDAARSDAGRPLLTYYDDDSGERTELSVATFANWTAKTANLLVDELGAIPPGTVALRLPVHWQAPVWVMASWLAGLTVVLAPDPTTAVDVAVVTHEDAADLSADEVVSVALAPFGLPAPGRTPTRREALDFDRSVHAHGDRFPGGSVPSPALRTPTGEVSWEALLATARSAPGLEAGGRLLVTEPLDSVSAVLGAVVLPLSAGTAAVLVRSPDLGAMPGRIRQERLVASLGAGLVGLPGFRPPEPGIA